MTRFFSTVASELRSFLRSFVAIVVTTFVKSVNLTETTKLSSKSFSTEKPRFLLFGSKKERRRGFKVSNFSLESISSQPLRLYYVYTVGKFFQTCLVRKSSCKSFFFYNCLSTHKRSINEGTKSVCPENQQRHWNSSEPPTAEQPTGRAVLTPLLLLLLWHRQLRYSSRLEKRDCHLRLQIQ